MIAAPAIAIFLLQGAIFGLFVVAIRRRKTAAAINAGVVLLVALLPVAAEVALEALTTRSVAFGPTLPLWLGGAGILHVLGMLGLYESTWWWDHVTHTISGALVAALLYAALVVGLSNGTGTGSTSNLVMAVTVVSTLAVGIFWELLELVAREIGERLDIEPVLVHYGWRDTAADLVFDVLAAVLVIGAELRIFVPVLEPFPGLTRDALVGGAWILLGGSLLMASLVWLLDTTGAVDAAGE
jgi:hypothetical protein